MLFICFDSSEETEDVEVENAIERAFDVTAEEEADDIIERAEEILLKQNIERTFAIAATTNKI